MTSTFEQSRSTKHARRIIPCGACRQVIAEFRPSVIVICREDEGTRDSTIDELLPDTFQLD